MKKQYKKLSLALLCVAVVAQVEARRDKEDKDRSRRSENGVYVAKTPWPFAPVEDAVVGTAGVVTLDQTDADPSALAAVVPDAVPGVQYKRNKDLKESKENKSMNKKKKCTRHKNCNGNHKKKKHVAGESSN